MSDERNDILTDHAYDGIQEYDNPTPGWWNWIFVLTVLFSIVYFLTATLAGRTFSPVAFFDRASTEQMKKQYGTIADLAPDDGAIVRLASEDSWVKLGAALYRTNCASCHAEDASGLTGPNLTDDYYIWVKKPSDIHDVIANGRNNGAMPEWKNRLSPPEQLVLSAYVASLRGANVQGRRPAEGEAPPPWPNVN